MDIYSAQSFRRMDSYAINNLSISSMLLMETAARRVFESAVAAFGDVAGKDCAVFYGSGNNGGDGLAIARHIINAGGYVRCFFVGRREKMTGDCAQMEHRLLQAGGGVEELEGDISDYLQGCHLIFDAMFGVGLNSPMRPPASDAVSFINGSGAKVVAVDIASGVHSDSGRVMGSAVRADLTVTFSFAKPGHLLPPGGLLCGELKICQIGIPERAIATESPIAKVLGEDEITAILPKRRADAHKGDFGKLLLLCGSVGYTGAAALAAKAALRSGAGLVSLGVPERVYDIIATKCDEAMVFPLPWDENGRLSLLARDEIFSRLEKADICLLGPGLGRSEELDRLVSDIVLHSKTPIILDADGINALSGNIDILKSPHCPLALTPHDGEFARLGKSVESRLISAREFAAEYGCVLVLKGHRTVVAGPDGTAFINTTGNPGMATGGSGDVLAGMIAALAGQGMDLIDACAAGVWLHGRAGDVCEQLLGQYGMLPTDMIDALPGLLP